MDDAGSYYGRRVGRSPEQLERLLAVTDDVDTAAAQARASN